MFSNVSCNVTFDVTVCNVVPPLKCKCFSLLRPEVYAVYGSGNSCALDICVGEKAVCGGIAGCWKNMGSVCEVIENSIGTYCAV